MSLIPIPGEAAEPVSLPEARLQVRIDADIGEAHPDDAMLESLITAAREAAEQFTACLFTAGAYELLLDCLPARIDFPVAPVGAVEAITYLDAAGVAHDLPEEAYRLYPHPTAPALLAAPGMASPEILATPGAVRVRFTGGYDGEAAKVPRAVCQAILLIVGHLYANREDVVVGAAVAELPQGSKALLWPYRRGLGV